MLAPHLPTLVPLLDAISPYIDVLAEESTLHRLLEHASHVAARLRLMAPRLRTLLPPEEPDSSGLLVNALLAGAETKKPGGRPVSAGAANGHPSAEGGAGAAGGSSGGLLGSIKRMFGPNNGPNGPSGGAERDDDGPDLGRIASESDGAAERMCALEKEFRAFKERAMWAKQRDHMAALKVSRSEERLLEVGLLRRPRDLVVMARCDADVLLLSPQLEEERFLLEAELREIETVIVSEEKRVGGRALREGRQRKMINRGVPQRQDTVLGLSLHKLNL